MHRPVGWKAVCFLARPDDILQENSCSEFRSTFVPAFLPHCHQNEIHCSSGTLSHGIEVLAFMSLV